MSRVVDLAAVAKRRAQVPADQPISVVLASFTTAPSPERARALAALLFGDHPMEAPHDRRLALAR